MKRLTPVRRRLVATGLGGALALGLGAATPALAGLAESPVKASNTHTVTAWGTSNDKAGGSLTDITVRNIVNLTVGGTDVRVRLSNFSGTAPLALSSVWVGTPTSSGSATSDPGGSASASCLRASWSRGVPTCSMSIATT